LQEKIAIFLCVLFLAGCSVKRIKFNSSPNGNEKDFYQIETKDIIGNNLTGNSFFIQKAEIEIVNGTDKQRFIASIKFGAPDSFLISIKSNTGIEAARVLLTKDTVLINDRINKTLYYGSESSVIKKYGFSSKLLPVFFGDVIGIHLSENAYNCKYGLTDIKEIISGSMYEYKLDCSTGKLRSFSVKKEIGSESIRFDYYDYDLYGKAFFLRKLKIRNLYGYDLININFNRLEMPWKDNIRFIPGKNYEQVEIK
jgi:hypothetical protein